MLNGTNHSTNGNGAHAAVAAEHELLWDALAPRVTHALSQPLDPSLVSQRRGRGGRVFDYLEGHVVIALANEVFGFGGWGYELAGEVALRRIESVDARTGEVKVTNAYSAPVRVTVAGAPPRTDVGFHAVAEESAEGHETAVKGAVTDGMKRALRSFGGRFGNGLYGDHPAPDAGRAARPRREPSQDEGGAPDIEAGFLRSRLVELGAEQGFDEAKVRAAVRRQAGRDLDELTAEELGPLVESAANKLRERQARAA